MKNFFVTLLSKFPKPLLGIGEQGLHSAYSFIIVAVAGRALTQDDFGMFALVWSAYPIVLLLFSSAFTRPLSIVYPAANESEQANLRSFSELLMKGCWFVFATAALFYAAFTCFDSNLVLLLACAGIGLMATRMGHETSRRLSLADNQHENTVLYTIIMLLPGVIVLPLLFLFQKNLLASDRPDSFAMIVLACLAIPCTLLLLFKRKNKKENNREAWASLLPYSKPLLLAAVIETVFKRLSPYLMTIGAGVAEAGVWAAARTVIGPAQVILLGVTNTALPAMRRAYSERGHPGLNSELKKYSLLLAALYLLPLVILSLFSEPIIKVLIGVTYPGAAQTLIIYCAVFAVMGFNSLATTYLQAIGFVRQQVVISVIASIVSLIGMAFIVIYKLGAVYVAYLGFATEMAATIVLLKFVMSSHNDKFSFDVLG